MVETLVNGVIPFPLTYPVSVVAPVPPFGTGKTGKVAPFTDKTELIIDNPDPKVISVASEEVELDPLRLDGLLNFANLEFVIASTFTIPIPEFGAVSSKSPDAENSTVPNWASPAFEDGEDKSTDNVGFTPVPIFKPGPNTMSLTAPASLVPLSVCGSPKLSFKFVTAKSLIIPIPEFTEDGFKSPMSGSSFTTPNCVNPAFRDVTGSIVKADPTMVKPGPKVMSETPGPVALVPFKVLIGPATILALTRGLSFATPGLNSAKSPSGSN